MKKSLAALMALGLCLAAYAGASPFSDVPAGHWAYNAVKALSDAGILTGYSDGNLKGGQEVSRYEFALLLARAYDQLGKDPELLKNLSPETLSDMSMISEEFKDELALLGVRREKLSSTLAGLRGEIKTVKSEVKSMKATRAMPNPKLAISGDSTVKYSGTSYSDNSDTRPFARYYNTEYFEQRISLNLSLKHDAGVRGFLRLDKFGDWDTANSDWSAQDGTFGTQNSRTNTDLRASLVLIDFTELRGLSLLRIGRQPFRAGNLLNISGTYDGIVLNRELFPDPFYQLTVAGFKYNNAAVANGFTDPNDNDGLDLGFISVKGNYEDRFMYELYYSRLRNASGTLMPDGTANIGIAPEDSLETLAWLGLSLNFNINQEWQIFGEISQKSWDESVNLDADPDLEKKDLGYIAGFNYQHDDRNSLRAHYLRYGDWFTSIGVTGGSIIRRAEAMKYWRNFHSYLVNYSHSFDPRSSIVLRYEDIDDDSDLAANTLPDDRNVMSLIYRYKYKPNSRFSLTYRRIDTNGGDGKTVTPVAIASNSGFIDNAVVPALAADTVADLYQLNLQLDINF
ncbi:MAG: S-layer homology domain-containing protein [Candidatus Wallbacteria bacterium]|nr:S-layer homology domain-containing protein [Candidatus Wallbacteria bacterium]